MTTFKINGTDFTSLVSGLRVGYEVLVSDDSGRNANGDTVIDIVNRKRKLYVTFKYMTEAQMKELLAAVQPFVVEATFRNPKTQALTTITTYIGTPEPEYYTIQSKRVLVKPMELNFIELQEEIEMQTMSTNWLANITAPSRIVKGKAELYRNSALVYTFLPTDNLASIKLERTTESGGLFGYTVCQKVTVEILDKDIELTIAKDDELRIYTGTETEFAKNPKFYVEEFTRDEVKGNITIVAYDIINKSTKHLQKELEVSYPINLAGYATLVANVLGTSTVWTGPGSFTYPSYTDENAPNFSGNETLRDVLNAIAEITGTICYVDANDKLCFKRLGAASSANIDKSLYFELKLGELLTLTQVTHTTELGDNLSAGTTSGYNYIFRNNPFIELRADAADILTSLLNAVKGLTFYSYSLKWRGNPALDIGDKVTLTTQDDNTVEVFYLGDTLTYNGGMVATSEWQQGEKEEVDSAPTTIGEAINQTVAKVDKVNKQITLMASQTEEGFASIGQLIIDTEQIAGSVSSLTTLVEEGLESASGALKTLEEKVDYTVDKDSFDIEVKKIISDGVEKVETTTGYTFDEEGLTISKTDSDISTQITENGMRVSKDGEVVLSADSEGVKAEDLHATTFLIIGDNARFEEFIENDETRVGCFWIGG